MRTFIIEDEQFGQVIIGDIDRVMEYIKSYLEEMGNGDEITFEILRQDMTKEEIEAAPEI